MMEFSLRDPEVYHVTISALHGGIVKALIVASLVGVACAANAGEAQVAKTINLDDRREVEKLAARQPELYAKIETILQRVGDQPPERVGRWMKTSFDAEDARYGYFLKTSDPPKAELSFVLGDTKYHAQVTLRNVRAKVFSARLQPERNAAGR